MGLEAAVVGGIISGAGALGAAGISAASQSATNEANADLARENNQTQINLANTAHQREVADLKAAGLNPILSAGGSGSAVPGLTTPTMVSPLANIGDAMKAGITDWSAIKQGEAIDSAIEKTKSEARLNDANALLSAAQVNSAVANQREVDARIPTYAAGIAKTRADTVNTNADTNLKNTGYAGRVLGAGLANSATSAISDKIKSVIDNIHVNSAKKVTPKKVTPSFPRETKPHDGSVEHLLPSYE